MPADHIDRRTFIAGAGASSLAVWLAACGGVEGESSKSGKTPTTASANHPKVAGQDLVFSNWPLYIDKKVLRQWERQTGGNVRYIEEINDNFEFFSKVRQQLQRGKPIGRDIVVLTDYMAGRWIRNGWVEPLDKGNIPNVTANLESNLASIAYDPNRSYTVPWQSGAVGIGYDPKRTGKKLHSVNDLFDPSLKGRVSFLSEPYDSAGLVMLGQGVDPTKANLDQINAAIDKIEEAQKAGQIRRFTGNDYTTDLAKGNLHAAMAYSGDLVQLQADNPDLEFVFPDEGAMLFNDNMLIPKGAAHPYAAETMMNFVYDPEVAATIAAYVNYISPVKGVKEVIAKDDPKIANNPLIFPPDDIRAKLHNYPDLSPADERAMRARMAEVTGG
jgi:spermidine/putrescine transport system substrate-binding protein